MLAYLSQNADKRIMNALEQEGFEIVPLAPFSALQAPVDTHADMLILAVDDVIFVHRDYSSLLLSDFAGVIEIDEPISDKYPEDVLLNVAVVGKNVFANTKHTSRAVLEYLKERDFKIHHVAQGYAHCSTLIVDENAIISADPGIIETGRKAGLDVLHIESGHVTLAPYEYGFIGGACGCFEDKIYLCGSLKYHPDGEKIKEFCKNHGKAAIELGDFPLTDIGGILFK